MSVAPRWKRRADEIAEAIGDELSVNGTVSIGNDVSLSVATITALANAITSVLNPTSIAAAIWLGQEVGTHVATVVAPVAPLTARQYVITLNGVYQHTVSHLWTYDVSSQISGNDYAVGTVINVLLTSGTTNQYRFLNPTGLVHDVNVVSTNTTPVHVQVRNLASGFTAMATDISQAMKLSAQPVSVADTVKVKTATGEAVAISGTVNLNVGSSSVPISNPNNITVPVVNSNSVTVPVSLGGVTVPVKATAAGIPQNANGISLYLPVDANHGLTIPVGGGVTSIPVSGGTSSVPISGGTSSVPVANTNSIVVPVENTNNVTIPVTASGTILDVNIKTIEASAKTQFHEAMETAVEDTLGTKGWVWFYHTTNGWYIYLPDGSHTNGNSTSPLTLTYNSGIHVPASTTMSSDEYIEIRGTEVTWLGNTHWRVVQNQIKFPGTLPDAIVAQVQTAVTNGLNNADEINTVGQAGMYYGTVVSYSSTHITVKDTSGTSVSAYSIHISGAGDTVIRTVNTVAEVAQCIGLRVATTSSDYATTPRNWFTVDGFPGGL